jgi:predicted Zn-dependent protease
MRPRWLWLGLSLGLLVVASLAWHHGRSRSQRFRADLDAAKHDLTAGRNGAALRRLTALAAAHPGDAEVAYQLGIAELRRGRLEAAWSAWERIPKDSPRAGAAALQRARTELKSARLGAAEDWLRRAMAVPGPHAPAARNALVRLLRLEGRDSDARRTILEGARAETDPISTVRWLYRMDTDPFPAEQVRSDLERLGRQDPNEDRVWLARAAFATRMGRLDEADRLLRACRARRRDDVAVWRGQLAWALADGRPDAVFEAAAHLPARECDPSEVLALRAWLAARAGDHKEERRALEALHEREPGDAQALDRLAQLALDAGRADEAARLRRAKDEVDGARYAYQTQLSGRDPAKRAPELARLATILGRRLDAACWSDLAAGKPPRSVLAHAGPSAPPSAAGRTLADMLPAPRSRLETAQVRRNSLNVYLVPRFTDDAEAIGLRFLHESGGLSQGQRLIPPVTASGGVAVFDYDGDGWMDVYAVQGGPFPPMTVSDSDRLFRNRRDGTFEDVTQTSGIAALAHGYGHGVAVGDFDNDGRPDLFITRWRAYALYRNRGDGTFEDATERAGLAGDRDWPTSAAFADLDGDGDLDLYVCHYLRWDESRPIACADSKDPTKYHCNPRDFPAMPDHLFRNDGGRFVDVTREAGIVDTDGRGLGVVAAHLDDDDRIDLFVANDTTANYLFRNLGGLRFREDALISGVAANGEGGYQAGMGVACGDLDGDGRVDLAVTNFYGESTTFFHNLGEGLFADRTAAIGLAAPSRFLLGFGIALLDSNNDGRLEVLTANGHIHDGRPQFPWKMPLQLLIGGEGSLLVDVSEQAGDPFLVPHIGRGLAAGDLDNDGRMEAVVLAQDEPLVALHNRTEGGHFLTLLLEGTASNHDAVGTRVTVHAAGRRQVAQRTGGGSYQSAADPRLHFGLGAATRVELVELHWPSGQRERYENLDADRQYVLREGAGQRTKDKAQGAEQRSP